MRPRRVVRPWDAPALHRRGQSCAQRFAGRFAGRFAWRTASGNLKLLLASRVTGMVNPNGARKLAWDWLVVCFVVYTTLATPLDLAFFDTACAQADSSASRRARQRGLVSRA